VYLEIGSKRVFATAVDWPGWCRSGRDDESALQALVTYGQRYKKAIGRAGQGLRPPAEESAFDVVERLEGNATTDFGVPAVAPSGDGRPVPKTDAKQMEGILKASWAKFDRAARAASGKALRKGPRGGGRALEAIIQHVLDADQAYLAKLGGKWAKPSAAADVTAEMSRVRSAILELLASRVRGDPPPRTPRSGFLWTPRYFVRRAAWHALDHAWEIEDRSTA
jgi:hypothetical protein